MRLPKKILFVLIGAAALGWTAMHFSGGSPDAGAGMQGGAPPVTVAEVIVKPVVEWDEFSGRLSAVESVEIRPRVSCTIESIHFEDGQQVKKGDALFIIDQKPYAAALERAQAILNGARARSSLANVELKRAQKLVKEKVVPQRTFDERKQDAVVTGAEVEAALALYKQAQIDYDYTKVVAPIDGRVSRAEITVGNLVESGGGAPILTTIVSDNPIYADFDVDEQTYLRYQRAAKQGDRLTDVPVYLGLTGEEGTPHEGKVKAFDNQLNTRAGTIRVRAVFDNARGDLLPGLFARVRIGGTGEREAVLVSERALGTDQSKKFVMVVGADNVVNYREVTLGPVAEDMRIVRSGLKKGEVIVVNGLQRVRPGSPVQPTKVNMEDADAPPAAAGQASPEAPPATSEEKPEAAAETKG